MITIMKNTAYSILYRAFQIISMIFFSFMYQLVYYLWSYQLFWEKNRPTPHPLTCTIFF